MTTSDWASLGTAAAAVIISVVTAYLSWKWRVEDRRGADVTAYFHRNSAMAKVALPSGETRTAGYNLVFWNRGPEVARNLQFRILDHAGEELDLLGVEDNEFPLDWLEPGVRYPIPWLLASENRGRLFRCELSWSDGTGPQSQSLPLRRGETSL